VCFLDHRLAPQASAAYVDFAKFFAAVMRQSDLYHFWIMHTLSAFWQRSEYA